MTEPFPLKKIVRINGSSSQYVRMLDGQKKKFTEVRTLRSTMIKFEDKSQPNLFFSKNSYPTRYLYLYKQIKVEVRKNIEAKKLIVPPLDNRNVNYASFEPIEQFFKGYTEYSMSFGKCTELDISKAYYETAYQTGYLSEEFYKKCIALPKKYRLSLIGSIASVKMVFEHQKGKIVNDPYPVKDELLRNAWFHISKIVDDCMREMAAYLKESFLFYWVDGIYLLGEADYGEIIDYATCHYGYDFKIVEVDDITATLKNELISIAVKKKEAPKRGEKNPKVFSFSRNTLATRQRLLTDFKKLLNKNM